MEIRKMINKELNCQSDLEYYIINLIDDNIFEKFPELTSIQKCLTLNPDENFKKIFKDLVVKPLKEVNETQDAYTNADETDTSEGNEDGTTKNTNVGNEDARTNADETIESYNTLKKIFTDHTYLISEIIKSLLDLKLLNKLKEQEDDDNFGFFDDKYMIYCGSILQKQVNFNFFEIDDINSLNDLEKYYWKTFYIEKNVLWDIKQKYIRLVINSRDTTNSNIGKKIKLLSNKVTYKKNKISDFLNTLTNVKKMKNYFDSLLDDSLSKNLENKEIKNKEYIEQIENNVKEIKKTKNINDKYRI